MKTPTIGIQSKVIDTKAANKSGNVARGEALASVVFKDIKDNFGKMRGYLADIKGLDTDARKAFRISFQSLLNQARKAVKTWEKTPEHDFHKRTLRTLSVRVSEMVTFSKAIDGLWVPDMSQGYGQLIAGAVLFNRSNISSGKETAGRKAKPVLDKVKAFLDKLEQTGVLTKKDLPEVETLVHTWVQVREAASAVKPRVVKKAMPAPARQAPANEPQVHAAAAS